MKGLTQFSEQGIIDTNKLEYEEITSITDKYSARDEELFRLFDV